MGSQISKSESLRLLSMAENLPTVPDLLHEIFSASVNPDITVVDLVDLVRKDQSIAVMIIKTANSSYYNRGGAPVADLERSIIKIGITESINLVMSLTLMHGVLSGVNAKHISEFWVLSFLIAKASLLFAIKDDPREIKIKHHDVYLISLLQSIGRVAISSAIDVCYFDDEMCNTSGEDVLKLETERYGINYNEAGKFILNLWGIPKYIYDNIIKCDFNVDNNKSIEYECCKGLVFVQENLSHILTFEQANSEGVPFLKEHIRK